ncbi:hypothetical protein SAMN05444159_6855 [Bradyrhizobium lablabi]|uniref:Uncharacterized protein n=1 Tax=Bradyrhizobium lablabi TaxID=722472 RepID=A0A1M7DLG8_9BRAD|nr:hypothetical protein SAMN05444159_6855 [Bradyrhizobium lablabi]
MSEQIRKFYRFGYFHYMTFIENHSWTPVRFSRHVSLM